MLERFILLSLDFNNFDLMVKIIFGDGICKIGMWLKFNGGEDVVY